MLIKLINMRKNIDSKLIIWIVFVITFLGIIFSYTYDKLDKKENYKYTEISNNFKETIVTNDNIKEEVHINTNNIISYDIDYKSDFDVSGNIELKIKDDYGKELHNKIFNYNEIVSGDKLKFNLNEFNLKDNKYQFEFGFKLNNPITIYTNQNGQIKADQILKFTYKIMFKILLSIFFLIGICLIVIVGIKQINRLENIYLIFALFFGLINIVVSVPFDAPDEARHFFRAYDISCGNIVSNGYNSDLNIPVAYLPRELKELKYIGIQKNDDIYVENSSPIIFESLVSAIHNNNYSGYTEEYSLNGTYNINPVAYLPQVLFIKIGCLLNMSPILILYAARLGNLVFMIATMYIIIKFIPRFKLLFFALAMIPGVNMLASSCSTDPVLLSLIFTYFAYVIYLKCHQKQLISKKNFLIFGGILILIALIKLPYVLISLFALIVSDNKNTLKKNCLMILMQIIIAGCCYKLWGAISNLKSGSVIDSQHILFVINHPFKFIELIFMNMKLGIYGYSKSIISGSAWNYTQDDFITVSYLITISIITIKSSKKDIIKTKFDTIVTVSTIILICTAILFVGFTWQDVNFGSIWGIQGRYFTPIIPLMCIVLASNKKHSLEDKIMPYVLCYIIVAIMDSTFNLFSCNFLV